MIHLLVVQTLNVPSPPQETQFVVVCRPIFLNRTLLQVVLGSVRRIGNVTETIFARTINVFLDQIPANLLHVVPIQSAMQTDKATLYVLVYLDTLLNLTQSQDAPE